MPQSECYAILKLPLPNNLVHCFSIWPYSNDQRRGRKQPDVFARMKHERPVPSRVLLPSGSLWALYLLFSFSSGLPCLPLKWPIKSSLLYFRDSLAHRSVTAISSTLRNKSIHPLLCLVAMTILPWGRKSLFWLMVREHHGRKGMVVGLWGRWPHWI